MLLKKYLLIAVVLTIAGSIHAQTSNALYYFWGAPQSTMLNPAINPKANFYAGFATGLQVSNNALDLDRVLKYNASLDSSEFFYSTNEGTDEFLDRFADANFIESHPMFLLNLGFRAGNLYIGFDLNTKTDAYLTYPGDLPRLIFKGNLDNSEFDFTNTSIDLLAYQEVATRLAYDITPNITLGWRGKLLVGIGNLSTSQTNLTLNADHNQWNLPIQTSINFSSAALQEIENFGEVQNIDSLDFEIKDPADFKPMDAFSNFGFGMDLGINVNYTDRLEFAASLVDLGYINWKTNVYNMEQDGEITIDPVDFDSLNSNTSYTEALVDDILNELAFEYSQNSYVTWLPTKLYLSARYLVHPKIGFGLVSRTTLYQQNLQQAFTLSTNLYPLKGFSLSLSYSYMNRTFQNAGLAMMITPLSPVLRILPIDFFFIIDNLPVTYAEEVNTGLPIPHKMRAVTFMTGFNLRLGLNKKKRLAKDEPLFYY